MLDDLMDSFADCLDAQSLHRFSELSIRPDVRVRISALAEKANEGLLSEEERSSYEAAINTADIMSIIKLKAQERLAATREL